MGDLLKCLQLDVVLEKVPVLEGTLSVAKQINATLEHGRSDFDVYKGETEIKPKAFTSQTLETKRKLMKDNITVLEVPYFKVSNNKGETVYIASEIEVE